MAKRARLVIAGLEEGRWRFTTFFDCGIDINSAEWDGDWCGKTSNDPNVPNEEIAFKYLSRRYGGAVMYDFHTRFEYDETYLPVGTPVKFYVACMDTKSKSEKPKVIAVCKQWRLVRYPLNDHYARLAGRRFATEWKSVFDLVEKRGD